MKSSTSALALAGAMILAAGPAIAQETAQTIPGVGNFSLPSSTPTPRPTPTPGPPSIPNAVPIPTLTPVAPTQTVPAPIASPSARLERRTLPRVTPTPRATFTPRAAPPQPQAVPAPTAPSEPSTVVPSPESTEAASEPTPGFAAPPQPTPIASSTSPEQPGSWPLGWIAALVALVVIGAALVAWRRKAASEPVDWSETTSPEPGPLVAAPSRIEPVPAAAPATPRFLERSDTGPATPVTRSWIDLSIMPRRAGLNLVTATADIGLVLRNTGDVPARNIRVDVRLLSARGDQDGELRALFAAPMARPVTPAFDLAPGIEKTTRALATLLRDDINVLTAATRPMFVPIVAVNILYDRGDGGTGQTAAAYAIGIERSGSEKLAPFWLDQPNMMHETLGQRPHALSLRI